MSDLLKTFSFDLQRFVASYSSIETGQTINVPFSEIAGLSSVAKTAFESGTSIDGKFVWNGSEFVAGTFAGATSAAVQLEVTYDVIAATGVAVTGVDGASEDDVYTFYNITAVNGITFGGVSSVTGINAKFSSFEAGAGSTIGITSDTPVTLDGLGTGIPTFTFSGTSSISLEQFNVNTKTDKVTDIRLTDGTMSVSAGVTDLVVNDGTSSAGSEITVDKSFSYVVGDDTYGATTIVLSEAGAKISEWDHATQIAPTKANDASVTVGTTPITYTSNGNAVVVVDDDEIQGFAFGTKGDQVTFGALPAGSDSTAAYNIRFLGEASFIAGDLNFANLSANGFTAAMTGGDSAGNAVFTITPTGTASLNNDLVVSGTGNALVIDANGALTSVELTKGAAISGDLSNLGKDADTQLLSGGSSVPIDLSGLAGNNTSLALGTDESFTISGLSADAGVNFSNVEVSFESASSTANISFNAKGELKDINTGGEGTTINIAAVSGVDLPEISINGQVVASTADFNYSHTADGEAISIEESGAVLTKAGNATRVAVSGDSAVILGATFTNLSFGSESSGFNVSGGAVTAVVMEDGDSFSTDGQTADAINIISGGVSIAKPSFSNLDAGTSLSFNRVGEDYEVSGFKKGAGIASKSTSGAGVTFNDIGEGTTDDDVPVITFNTDGNVTNVSNLVDGTNINVSGGSATVEGFAIATGGGFSYGVSDGVTNLNLAVADDSISHKHCKSVE